MRRDILYIILSAALLVLLVIPVGTAVFILGFVYGDSPCVMCWEQRTGMAIIALIGLFLLRYGPRPKYIGLSVLVGAWGVFMGLRHTGMHAARDVGQGFSIQILGAHTYTWALFIFWVCIVTMGMLLMAMKESDFSGVRSCDKFALHCDGAELECKTTGDLTLRPSRHDAFRGVLAGPCARIRLEVQR